MKTQRSRRTGRETMEAGSETQEAGLDAHEVPTIIISSHQRERSPQGSSQMGVQVEPLADDSDQTPPPPKRRKMVSFALS